MRASFLVTAAIVLACAGVSGGAPDEGARAVEVYARGDYAGAVKILAPLHAAGKANIQQRLILTRAYLHLGKDNQALSVLRSVLKTDRENPEANSLTGQILLKTKKHKEALKYLERAYRLKAEAPTAAALGKCYHALGRTAKAKAYLQRALTDDIRDPGNSFELGKICLERGSGALAQKYLLMAREAGMESLELHLLLGRAYLLQRKFVGPVMVVRIDKVGKVGKRISAGDLTNGHVVLGRVAGVADRYKVCTQYSALYEGLEVLKRSAGHPDGHYMAARGWFAAGRLEPARKHLKQLLAAEPKSRRARMLQGQLLIAARDFAGLEKCLADALAVKAFDDETIADFHFHAALWLRAQGKRKEAIAQLQKAEKLHPTSAKVLRALAGLCVATGRKTHARQYYARMVELFPDAHDIDELRNALKVLKENAGGRS